MHDDEESRSRQCEVRHKSDEHSLTRTILSGYSSSLRPALPLRTRPTRVFVRLLGEVGLRWLGPREHGSLDVDRCATAC